MENIMIGAEKTLEEKGIPFKSVNQILNNDSFGEQIFRLLDEFASEQWRQVVTEETVV